MKLPTYTVQFRTSPEEEWIQHSIFGCKVRAAQILLRCLEMYPRDRYPSDEWRILTS